MNEPFFVGHFPNNPVMPGVLQLEALAQACGVLVLIQTGEPQNYWPYFVSIDRAKFRKRVGPGDILILECHLQGPAIRGHVKMHARAFVGNDLACEAQMSAVLVKKDHT